MGQTNTVIIILIAIVFISGIIAVVLMNRNQNYKPRAGSETDSDPAAGPVHPAGRAHDFVFPAGRWTPSFASQNESECRRALHEISSLSRRGNRTGLDELESFIRINCNDPAVCRFYATAGMSVMFNARSEEAIGKLIAYAAKDGVFNHCYEVQTMLNPLALTDALDRAVDQLKTKVSWQQARAFELLLAQVDVAGEFGHALQKN